MRKRIWKILAGVAAVLVVALVGAGVWIRAQVAGSLPKLDGQIAASGIDAEIVIERDSLGIPTIHAGSRADLAFATGFVHAQDRFFQMDLLRRNSAGELAEIVGPAVVEADRRVRVNRFRDVARRMLAASSDEDRALLDVYAAGVNAGVRSLAKRPFEYLLLGVEPVEWKPEDSRAGDVFDVSRTARNGLSRRGQAGADARRAARGALRVSHAARHGMGRADRRRGIRSAADSRS